MLADIADARAHGAEAIFLVDDNITLDVERFEALCQAIVDAGFDDSDYVVQAMTAPLAEHGARLAPLMRRAGFRYVFLGIENILDDDLQFLRARAKNARRDKGGRVGNASIEAIAPSPSQRHVRRRRPDRRQPGRHAQNRSKPTSSSRGSYIDWPYIQHPTPYPRTPMTRDFRERGLIVDEDVVALRRHHGGRAQRARVGRRDRVPAVARRPLDETEAHAGGAAPQPVVRARERARR